MNAKQKKGFNNSTLLNKNVRINLINDRGWPLTLIPEYFFNNTTPLEPLKNTNENVKSQKINFAGQTKTKVKTNKETIELRLLITRAQTAVLMDLD